MATRRCNLKRKAVKNTEKAWEEARNRYLAVLRQYGRTSEQTKYARKQAEKLERKLNVAGDSLRNCLKRR